MSMTPWILAIPVAFMLGLAGSLVVTRALVKAESRRYRRLLSESFNAWLDGDQRERFVPPPEAVERFPDIWLRGGR